MKERYWKRMINLKYQIYYLDEYTDVSHKWDNIINIITGIASASSIGVWALWKDPKYVWIWSTIIAMSQVINAIKIYLPFSKRIKFLPKISSELSEIYNEYDYLWFKVSNGSLTDDKINDELKKLIAKEDKISNKYLIENHLPDKPELITKAFIKTEEYCNTNY